MFYDKLNIEPVFKKNVIFVVSICLSELLMEVNAILQNNNNSLNKEVYSALVWSFKPDSIEEKCKCCFCVRTCSIITSAYVIYVVNIQLSRF